MSFRVINNSTIITVTAAKQISTAKSGTEQTV